MSGVLAKAWMIHRPVFSSITRLFPMSARKGFSRGPRIAKIQNQLPPRPQAPGAWELMPELLPKKRTRLRAAISRQLQFCARGGSFCWRGAVKNAKK